MQGVKEAREKTHSQLATPGTLQHRHHLKALLLSSLMRMHCFWSFSIEESRGEKTQIETKNFEDSIYVVNLGMGFLLKLIRFFQRVASTVTVDITYFAFGPENKAKHVNILDAKGHEVNKPARRTTTNVFVIIITNELHIIVARHGTDPFRSPILAGRQKTGDGLGITIDN